MSTARDARIDDIMDQVQMFGDAMMTRFRIAESGSMSEYSEAFDETKRLKDGIRDSLVSLAQPGEGALTDERIWEMWLALQDELDSYDDIVVGLARKVEAHHGITSTPTGDSNG